MRSPSVAGYLAICILVISLVADSLFIAMMTGAFDKKHKLKKPDPATDGSASRVFCGDTAKFGGQPC
jgi:hypothetical protein